MNKLKVTFYTNRTEAGIESKVIDIEPIKFRYVHYNDEKKCIIGHNTWDTDDIISIEFIQE